MSSAAFIKISSEDIARIKHDFKLMNDEVPVGLSRAINRTLTAVNTEGSNQVRKIYNLKVARIKRDFTIRKSTRRDLSGFWRAVGEPVGLIQFGARQNRKGVSVKVEAAASRTTINHAFIQVGQNGGEHVFWREKRGGKMVPRYDILRREGPRIEDALSKPKVQKALQKKADETLQKRLDAEANYILSKAGKL